MLLLILQCSHLKPGTFILSTAYYIGRSIVFHILMVAFEIWFTYIVRSTFDRMINSFQCFNSRIWTQVHILSTAYLIGWSIAFNVSMVPFEPRFIYVRGTFDPMINSFQCFHGPIWTQVHMNIVRGIFDRMINSFQCFNGRIWTQVHILSAAYLIGDELSSSVGLYFRIFAHFWSRVTLTVTLLSSQCYYCSAEVILLSGWGHFMVLSF